MRIAIFGESHGDAIGVTMEGFPAGFFVDMEALQAFLRRRAPGRHDFSTPRQEDDSPVFLSGFLKGHITGAPLTAIIPNNHARRNDYPDKMDVPRPGHADFSAEMRYHGAQDSSGGGHFSGRLTAPLCIAGGIAKQILETKGVFIGAHLQAVAGIQDDCFDSVHLSKDILLRPASCDFPVLNPQKGDAMKAAIEQARNASDSVGGRIEAAAIGVPAGWGSPMFDGVENRLASLLFGIPAVRGVEFGLGMAAAECRGSSHNDAFVLQGKDCISTATNHHGGILGGITTGMPIIVKVAVKPTPSIALEQRSVSLSQKKETMISTTGRHDPCIAPRAVPVVEAALAVALLDLALEAKTYSL